MAQLRVVSGAPGSGKTTLVEAMLQIEHEFMVFDIDWLIEHGSDLIGKRIQEAPEAWQPWSQLWFEVLHSVIRNGGAPIFFCPNSPADFARFGVPDWCEEVHWLLLDCPDEERIKRLNWRGWADTDIDAANVDATELRAQILITITSNIEPAALAQQVINWAVETVSPDP